MHNTVRNTISLLHSLLRQIHCMAALLYLKYSIPFLASPSDHPQTTDPDSDETPLLRSRIPSAMSINATTDSVPIHTPLTIFIQALCSLLDGLFTGNLHNPWRRSHGRQAAPISKNPHIYWVACTGPWYRPAAPSLACSASIRRSG